jgi:hypothetical protein
VHVLSESAACVSEEEGRRLVDAVDKSAATYPFAENYVVHPHVRLIRELVERGEVGRPELIEADYLHGMSPEAIDALVEDPAGSRSPSAAPASGHGRSGSGPRHGRTRTAGAATRSGYRRACCWTARRWSARPRGPFWCSAHSGTPSRAARHRWCRCARPSPPPSSASRARTRWRTDRARSRYRASADRSALAPRCPIKPAPAQATRLGPRGRRTR